MTWTEGATPAIDLKRKMAEGRDPNKSRAPVRKPLPKLKLRYENRLCARRSESVWKWTKKAAHQLCAQDHLRGRETHPVCTPSCLPRFHPIIHFSPLLYPSRDPSPLSHAHRPGTGKTLGCISLLVPTLPLYGHSQEVVSALSDEILLISLVLDEVFKLTDIPY